MRVFVYPEKTYEELGTKRWDVEWHQVSKAALKRVREAEARGESDEFDRDNDVLTYHKPFPWNAKTKALAFARKMAKCEDSAFGCATVTPEVVDWYVEEDRIAEWANAGDPIYVP